MEAKPRSCCLSLCVKYNNDFKQCTLCGWEMCGLKDFDGQKVAHHYAVAHPELKLTYRVQTFDQVDHAQVVPCLDQKTYYYVNNLSTCDHHY